MSASQEKAAWLSKANPYKQRYLWDAWREGARAFWTGTIPEWHGNSRERAAFNKGFAAAEQAAEDRPVDPGYYVACGQTDYV